MKSNAWKNLPKRIEFWLIWLICGILIDELIKEGYLFSMWDAISPSITHEKIILAIVIAYLIFKVWRIKHKKFRR